MAGIRSRQAAADTSQPMGSLPKKPLCRSLRCPHTAAGASPQCSLCPGNEVQQQEVPSPSPAQPSQEAEPCPLCPTAVHTELCTCAASLQTLCNSSELISPKQSLTPVELVESSSSFITISWSTCSPTQVSWALGLAASRELNSVLLPGADPDVCP